MKMSEQNLVSRLALDKNGDKLGEIVKTREEKNQYYAFIHVKRLFAKNVIFPLSLGAYQLIKTQDDEVYFDILKEDFNKEVKRYLAEIKQKVKSAKFAEASGTTKAISYAFTWGKL